GLTKRLADLREERRRLQDRQTDLQMKGQALSAAEQQRLTDVESEISLGEFERTLREYESQPWKAVLDPGGRARRQQLGFRYVVNAFIDVLTVPRNERIVQLRRTWPDLARLCVAAWTC